MKVQVNIKTLASETVTIGLTVAPEDDVQTIKERVALLEPNPFPQSDLSLAGAKLPEGKTLAACGVKDGVILDFEAKPSEDALASQLAELLTSRGALPTEELGLLYTLKHGVTVGVVLQALGKHELLGDFLGKFSKRFSVEGGQAKLVDEKPKDLPARAPVALGKIPEDAAVQALDIVVDVALELPAGRTRGEELSLRVGASDTVGDLKAMVAAAILVPFAGALSAIAFGGKDLPDGERLSEAGVGDGARLAFTAHGSEEALSAQLREILASRGPLSRVDLDNLYCCRYGVGAGEALRMLGWGEKLSAFLQRHPGFWLDGGHVSLSEAAPVVPPCAAAVANRPYLDLHEELCADDFHAKVAEGVDALAALLSDGTFLNVRRAAPGGAAVSGTGVPGAAGAEVVLFVGGWPPSGQENWLHGIAASVASTLAEQLPELLPGVTCAGGVAVAPGGGAVALSMPAPLGDVRISFAPDCASYNEALATVRGQDPNTQALVGSAAFATQKMRFMERLPDGVKATIRLLKWWRQRRQWSSEASRPSDELLELVAAHTAAKCPPADLASSVAGVLSALSNIEQLEVTWPLSSRCYREADIPKGLLSQRPLVLSPVSPLLNLASSQSFRPRELAEHARSGSFFS